MATKRIKDISTTATTFAADDFIALDASSVGTRKMAKASLITQVGANYLEKADNLSDVADKDTSKLNLEVPNVGTAANEVPANGMLGDLAFQSSAGVVVDDLTVDGQLTAAVGKPMPVNGPTMRFDGVDAEVAFAVTADSPFSFTNGTDDTAFTVAGWCKLASGWNTDERTLLSKFGSPTSAREWRVYIDDNYRIYAEKRGTGAGSSTTAHTRTVSNVLSDIDDKWMHICVVWLPAGPNSADAFTSAKAYIYVDGKLNVDAQSEQPSGPYKGMVATTGDVRIGSRQSFDYFEGEIRDVKLYNKELSLAEVREVYSNGQLGFAESTGTADVVTDGGFENWNTSTDLTDWIEKASVSVAQSTDKISGTYSCKLTGGGDIGSSGNNWLAETSVIYNANKKYRLTGRVKRFSGSTESLQFGAIYYKIIQFNGTTFFPGSTSTYLPFIGAVTSKDLGNGWYSFSIDFTTTIANTLTIGVNGSTDPYLIDDVSLVQIGSVLDARAEQFDTSTGKLYDLSGNDFVGTQSGGVQSLGKKFPVYETGTWTPSVTFGGGSTGITYSAQEGYYTRVGNLAVVTGHIKMSANRSSNGTARIAGLPITGKNMSSASVGASAVVAGYMSGLTSGVTAQVDDNATTATLYDHSATGYAELDHNNLTGATSLRFTITYPIQ